MEIIKHILITGGAGFIGSHLSKYLLNQRLQVTVIDNLSTGSFENIEILIDNSDFQFIYADICDNNFQVSTKPDIIFHLASTVGVDIVVNDPVNTLKNNIHSTLNVLNMAEKYNCRLVLFSSSEVYGNCEKFPLSEEQNYNIGSYKYSRWSYAVSKIVDEILAFSYNQRGLDCVVVRLFNVIGPFQSSRYGMVVPRFIKAALNSENLYIYGDGQQTRCFCDVRDIIYGLYKLLFLPENGFLLLNLGGDNEVSILDLAKRVIELTDSTSKIEFVQYEKLHTGFIDICRRVPDLEIARKLLNWNPNYSLQDSLTEIIIENKRLKNDKRF